MELYYSSYVVTLACVVGVWLTCPLAEGKCRGDWKAYHGCLGGNGKRSDSTFGAGPDDSPRFRSEPSALERLLRANLGASPASYSGLPASLDTEGAGARPIDVTSLLETEDSLIPADTSRGPDGVKRVAAADYRQTQGSLDLENFLRDVISRVNRRLVKRR